MYNITVDTIKSFASANTTRYLLRESLPGNIWANYTISFRYIDGSGNESYRVVEPRRVDDGAIILGWCHARREPRTFYFDRMADICTGGVALASLKGEEEGDVDGARLGVF